MSAVFPLLLQKGHVHTAHSKPGFSQCCGSGGPCAAPLPKASSLAGKNAAVPDMSSSKGARQLWSLLWLRILWRFTHQNHKAHWPIWVRLLEIASCCCSSIQKPNQGRSLCISEVWSQLHGECWGPVIAGLQFVVLGKGRRKWITSNRLASWISCAPLVANVERVAGLYVDWYEHVPELLPFK